MKRMGIWLLLHCMELESDRPQKSAWAWIIAVMVGLTSSKSLCNLASADWFECQASSEQLALHQHSNAELVYVYIAKPNPGFFPEQKRTRISRHANDGQLMTCSTVMSVVVYLSSGKARVKLSRMYLVSWMSRGCIIFFYRSIYMMKI